MNGHYDVALTPQAVQDLTEIGDYIAFALSSPRIASQYIRDLRESIGTLQFMPDRIALTENKQLRILEIRKMIFKNFYIYYRIDAKKSRVYVLAVIYARRNQLKALAKKDVWNY